MIVKAQQAQVVQVDAGVTRQILGHDPQLMLVRVTLRKGAVAALHTHPHRQVTYVESGAFEATVDGSTTYLVPPGAPHGVTALENGVLIDVFTPAREDFIYA
jgi:quercetin dioxygenase-like cupin family protein